MPSSCPCQCKERKNLDINTPRSVPISPFYKRSYAYKAVRKDFPLTLKHLMEDLINRRDEISEDYGQNAREELKAIVSELGTFKGDFQINAEFKPISADESDAKVFNMYLQKKIAEDGSCCPFNTPLLYTEAYFYRKIREIFNNRKILKNYDYFKKLKDDAYKQFSSSIQELAFHLIEICRCLPLFDRLHECMMIALCANSIELSHKTKETESYMSKFRELEGKVISDCSEQIWKTLQMKGDHDSIGYVLDNVGFELFADLCLADTLITAGLKRHVTFHAKSIPFNVSDATKEDFLWMVKELKKHSNPYVKFLGYRWTKYLLDKTWTIQSHPFWHYPVDFTYMEKNAPQLYRQLASEDLIIFKGDLAYRKLVGDMNWDPNTPIEQGLKGFMPTKICVISNVKSGVICGIAEDVIEKNNTKDPNWKDSGNYSLIQFCDTVYVEPSREDLTFPSDSAEDFGRSSIPNEDKKQKAGGSATPDEKIVSALSNFEIDASDIYNVYAKQDNEKQSKGEDAQNSDNDQASSQSEKTIDGADKIQLTKRQSQESEKNKDLNAEQKAQKKNSSEGQPAELKPQDNVNKDSKEKTPNEKTEQQDSTKIDDKKDKTK